MSTAAFRTTLATALALLAITGSVTFTQAKPNDGRFRMSSEALKQGFAQDCNASWNMLEDAQDLAEDLAEDGDMEGSAQASWQADQTWTYASRRGCAWAQ